MHDDFSLDLGEVLPDYYPVLTATSPKPERIYPSFSAVLPKGLPKEGEMVVKYKLRRASEDFSEESEGIRYDIELHKISKVKPSVEKKDKYREREDALDDMLSKIDD